MEGHVSSTSSAAPAPAAQVFPPLLGEQDWDRFVAAHGLTPREAEVLLCVTSGSDDRTACGRLGMTRPTLRTHLRSAYQKVGVHSRVELVLRLVHTYLVH
jgi:DNA-binding CsgD family transcriptional regulator